ncbi:MAG: GTP cyclohydrolase I FolE [Acidobacteria bacterium]|nr:MAG: GTP cyclohydrolase I FolE [Acidobacteriota bacterium]TDI11870.1 MAG: GTP cyclohydrolase I FolE [Acidobacteriota bacterium]
MEKLIESMLEKLGEDPQRQGLRKTPARVAETFKFLTKGYSENVDEILKDALFDVQYDEMVIIRNIEVYSLCEHHLLPFFGKCHVGYLPTRKVIGLSKVIRLVELFSRRLQVQERLTQQIAHTIQEQANPQGVGVIIEAQHLCMMMRGVEKQNVKVTTSTLLGKFRQDQRSRMEFLNLVRINNP